MNSRRHFLKQFSWGMGSLSFLPGIWAAQKGKLPNVLILGDSISIGYTPFVQEQLKGIANVFRPMNPDGKAENCQGTTYGVEEIDRWLAANKWDVIHFNFGLHDLKKVDPVTRKNSQNAAHPPQANLKQYKKNLQEIVKNLKKTKAELIFATTTPYPDTVEGPLRLPGKSKEYNDVALKIMKKKKIAIDDLYAFVLPRMEELQRPNNVHFTEKGSEQLAMQVSEAIKLKLNNMST